MRPPFLVCLAAAAANPDFVREWERLRGFRAPRAPIDAMVDEACGLNDEKARLFIEDVRELIYDRIEP